MGPLRKTNRFLVAASLASIALCQDLSAASQATTAQAPQNTNDTAQKDQHPASPPVESFFIGITRLTLRPQAGAVIFSGRERFTSGLSAGFDFFKSTYSSIGLSVGGLYSGLNSQLQGASGFFSGYSFGNRTYIIQAPLDITLTPFPGQLGRWSITPHFGADLIYSSAGVGTPFGSTPISLPPGNGQGSTWSAWPELGADVTYSLSSQLDISLRYNASILGAFALHTVTIGLGIEI